MPENAGERTEQATPRRRQEARGRGQVAKSQDLTAAVLILVGLFTIDIWGRSLVGRMYQLTYHLLGGGSDEYLQTVQLIPLWRNTMIEAAWILAPVVGILMVAAVLAALMQTGFLLTFDPLRPNLDKLNPVSGFQRMFSAQTASILAINLGKLGVVVVVVYYAIAGQWDKVVYASSLSVLNMVGMGVGLIFSVGIKVAIALLVMGMIDWLFQRYRHEQSLRMTKEEVKEELRRMEGDPLMKRRRREVQMQLAIQRLRKDVPQADVVVTNPTHLAVALRYDAQTMLAPRVLAKGQGYVAQRIREIALESGVPVVEKKPLARALYEMVEVGQEVPASLYKAVAEVLAYVYELSGKAERMRTPVEVN